MTAVASPTASSTSEVTSAHFSVNRGVADSTPQSPTRRYVASTSGSGGARAKPPASLLSSAAVMPYAAAWLRMHHPVVEGVVGDEERERTLS